ncbi:uncharacterized protein J8A68_000023 [[Candida] subhashii]|uniref:Uncharacterized protein n=1 Tax=[Candida] subhashii TaxID=561895 RepID=A0A8J5QNT5_9ASCO|nr:uncharacterized protein J8A68_000023 [[Candida] subhashii]KAG7666432.1 hypothetical protein J8A68_000023 [[Candida] subhashii]
MKSFKTVVSGQQKQQVPTSWNNETFFITAEAVFENGARYCHDRAEAIRMAQRQIHMVEEYQLDSHDYDETGTTTGATSRASISDSEVVINADSVLSEFTEIDSYEYGESVISSD